MQQTSIPFSHKPACVNKDPIANEILMHFRSRRKFAQDVFINDPIDTDKDGNALTFQDIMMDEGNIYDEIDLRIKSEQLYAFIARHLGPREREILYLRYGLGGSTPLTQREVADRLNISRSYVSRRAYCKHCVIWTKCIEIISEIHCFDFSGTSSLRLTHTL